MAVALKLSSSQSCDCKTLTLTDATGIYDASLNPTGWGNQNKDFTDINCACLIITLPDHATVYNVDLTSIFTDATVIGDLVFTIDMADLGATSSDKFEDGIYTIIYKVGENTDDPEHGYCTDGTVSSSTIYLPIYCQVQCCIISKISRIPQYYCCDTCKNDYVDYCFSLWLMLKALQNANVITSYVEFEKVLSQVEDLCNNKDCNCT